MLAYVFWHWPLAGTDPVLYERRLRSFHQALAAARPAGFLRSSAYSLRGASWVAAEAGYEDWYLLEGSTALDVLNDAAIAPPSRAPHDEAAACAAGGCAGLYRLRAGAPAIEQAPVGYWLAKPPGVTYDDFYARLGPLTSQAETGLWGRQMTLGPTPEFCLRSPAAVDLPDGCKAIRTELARVWP